MERQKRAEFTLVNVDAHVPGNSAMVGPKGALIFQDDVYHDLKLQAGDTQSYFVIGLVRRPCDFLVSSWSFTSLGLLGKKSLGPQGEERRATVQAEMNSNLTPAQNEERKRNFTLSHFGQTPPYDSPEDKVRFTNWLNNIADKREADTWRLPGQPTSNWMSAALDERYEDVGRVHCWVRTHKMVEDTAVCLQQYEACGGEYRADGLSPERVAAAKATAERGIPPSSYAACNSFFTAELMARVMKSEKRIIDQFGLETCCS